MKNIKNTSSVIPENSKNLSGIYKILKEKIFNKIQGRFLFSKEGHFFSVISSLSRNLFKLMLHLLKGITNILDSRFHGNDIFNFRSITFHSLRSRGQENNLKTKDYELKRPVFRKTGLNLGFTLVELIVVITILAILGTIAFVSFGSYSSQARDSGRIADLTNLSKGLALQYTTSGILPYPDGYITVNAGTGYYMYQGTAGKITLGIIKMSDAKDSLDNTYYSYSTNQTRTQYSVGGYLENQSTTAFNDILNSNLANAADYSKRYLLIKGNTVGILTESGTNLPIEQTTTAGTSVDLLTTTKDLKLNISSNTNTTGNNIINGTGLIVGAIQTSTINNGNYTAPTNCPEGFIAVPGNTDFNQPGFCIAKYEMSYDGVVIPDSTGGGTDWNTISYLLHSGSTAVSKAGNYPIADIKQLQAIDACTKIGSGYHLITNNEWMTIARNIEANSANWSSGITGSGYIYNGVSNSTMGCNGVTNTIYTLPRARATKTGEGSAGVGAVACDSKRKHTLSNGQVIYDLSGNVWEHVNKANTLDGTNYANGKTKFSNTTGWTITGTSPADYYGWNPTGWNNANITADERNKYGPSNSLYNHAINGIGNIHGWYINDISYTHNIFLRGGSAGSADSGVFAVGLYRSSAGAARGGGFRCAK